MNRKERRAAEKKLAAAPQARSGIASDLFSRALNAHVSGQINEAGAFYLRTIDADKNHAEAHSNLALIYNGLGQSAAAYRQAQTAIILRPDYFEAGLNVIEAQKKLGLLDQAITSYRRLTLLQPNRAEIWSNLGVLYNDHGQIDLAIEAFQTSVRLDAKFVDASTNLSKMLDRLGRKQEAADVLHALLKNDVQTPEILTDYGALLVGLGRRDQGVDYIEKAIQLAPTRRDMWLILSITLAEAGNIEGAIAACRRAMDLGSDQPEVQSHLAGLLNRIGSVDEAQQLLVQAIISRPNYANAYSDLSIMLGNLGRAKSAIKIGHWCVRILTNMSEPYSNLGVVLQQDRQSHAAVPIYLKSMVLKPEFSSTYGNLGIALIECGAILTAERILRWATTLLPSFSAAVSEHVQLRRVLCDWQNYDLDNERLMQVLERGDAVESIILMGTHTTLEQQKLSSGRSSHRVTKNIKPMFVHTPRATPRPSGKLHIGYISTDYREHPVGRLLPEMFAAHNRQSFEIYAYDYGPPASGPLRERIMAGVDHFIDINALSHDESARRIHQDGIDILVDLSGRTLGSRVEILALRPSPVQVSFIGFPGTMGDPIYDYIILDKYLAPFDDQEFYTERLVHLPNCYQPSDPYRVVSTTNPTRQSVGLPPDAFVFANFNNPFKITPMMFDVWMNILRGVDNSVLWFYAKAEKTQANIRAEAASRSVDPNRIIFASVTAHDEFLARLPLADLYLDTLPYNAGATCNDAIWAGLPVLTCTGNTYVGRMATSLLHAASLSELVTTSLPEYQALAIKLGRTKDLMQTIRARTALARHQGPLFDMVQYTADLERAYQHMTMRWQNGLPLEPFAVSAVA